MPQPPDQKPAQVFLSYSRSDRDACIKLRHALEKVGVAVFQDDDAIRAGDQWMSKLQAALAECSGFIVLVGRNGVRRWVGAEVQVALSRHLSPQCDAARLPIFPVLLDGTSPDALPPFLALFQATAWSQVAPAPDALVEAVTARTVRFDTAITFDGCPFLGLSAFQRSDAKLFFGRRGETLAALACLGDQDHQGVNPESLQSAGGLGYMRWLQIEGSSGAGKSSLVNAGLLPMIESGALWARTGFEHWKILGPMMPGKDPLSNLAEAIERALEEDPKKRDILGRMQRLGADERALAFELRNHKRDNTAFLLVIDQFEELFTFAEDAPRKQVDALLAHALQDAECPLFVISTVRSDFLDRLEQLPCLQALFNNHCRRYLLPTISEHRLREVIEQPAALAGLDVSEVTTAIIDDARNEPGALPLVENALFSLWNQRLNNKISGEQYRQANGLAGMLSAQADALLARLGKAVPKGRERALELLLALTRISDEGRHSRQRITREHAIRVAGEGNAELGESLVSLLSGGVRDIGARQQGALRLIIAATEQGRQYIDLIHETLIRACGKDGTTGKPIGYWPTLYDYIDRNRDRALEQQLAGVQVDRVRRKFESHVERWSRSGRFGRRWRLAGWINLLRYRKLKTPKSPAQAKFLLWSGRKVASQGALLLCLSGVLAESAWWVHGERQLPFWYALVKPLWVLGWKPLLPWPTTVEIPAGTFTMGCVPGRDDTVGECYADEFKEHTVKFDKPFTMGKFEVTFLQYDFSIWHRKRHGIASTAAVDIDYPEKEQWGRGQRPVINVNWHEAQAYAVWLSQSTGKPYQLPTEAHWEYAARAESKTAFWWGPKFNTRNANCENAEKQTVPVGSYPANGRRLHDTAGNAWEWVDTVYTKAGYADAPVTNPQREDPKTLGLRVVRGGSWNSDPRNCRAAVRGSFLPGERNAYFGFRVSSVVPIE